MATEQEIKALLRLAYEARPHDPLQEINMSSAGQGAVMHFLFEQREPVTAGQIAQALHGTTARTAVILKKLEAKGMIMRKHGEADARTIVVQLSDAGQAEELRHQREVLRYAGALIDEIGFERMLAFMETAREIREVMRDLSASSPKDQP